MKKRNKTTNDVVIVIERNVTIALRVVVTSPTVKPEMICMTLAEDAEN
jgi:hypothetical protein